MSRKTGEVSKEPKSLIRMVPRRGNNLPQTLACRAYMQVLPRCLRYHFSNPCGAGYQNSLNKQGRLHNKGGGLFGTLQIAPLTVQILHRLILILNWIGRSIRPQRSPLGAVYAPKYRQLNLFRST